MSGTNGSEDSEHATGSPDSFSWESDVPLLTNPLVLKQMVIVAAGAGLMMACLLTAILAAAGEFQDIPIMLLISLLAAAGLGLLMGLASLLFFGNRIRVRFTLNDKGALWETVDKRAITGARLAVLAGLLGGSPQTAGAGLLANARRVEFISWPEVAAVERNPRHLMIVLRGRGRPLMMLICRPDNYEQAAGYINERHNLK